MKPTLPAGYFDDLYSRNPDPWNFATKEYEHKKYQVTLDNLPRPHYERALELGCSIGVLTQLLAERVDRLLSLDTSEIALQQAHERCKFNENIEFCRATLPKEFPSGKFDLVLMSEVGYYFALPDLSVLADQVVQSLNPEGDLVLVHYLPEVLDYPLTGDEVHNLFHAVQGLHHVHGFREARYRFDNFRRV